MTRRISRRRALQVLAFSGAGAWLACGRRSAPEAVRIARPLMGTTLHLTVAGGDRDAAAAAAHAAYERMVGLESRLSRFRASSDVSRLNREGVLAAPSAALLDVLGLAQEVRGLGEGAFDVTIQPVLALYRRHASGGALPPAAEIDRALARVGQDALRVSRDEVRLERAGMAITLDGIAKGYVVDKGAGVLKRHGFGNVLVEAGGDLAARGRRGPGAWRIGIRSPRKPLSRMLARFEAEDVAVATSGDYFQAFTADRRVHHILDPRTGSSAPGLASATVTAPTAARADALATLAMVLGARRTIALLEEMPGCGACLVTKEREVVRTSGFLPA